MTKRIGLGLDLEGMLEAAMDMDDMFASSSEGEAPQPQPRAPQAVGDAAPPMPPPGALLHGRGPEARGKKRAASRSWIASQRVSCRSPSAYPDCNQALLKLSAGQVALMRRLAVAMAADGAGGSTPGMTSASCHPLAVLPATLPGVLSRTLIRKRTASTGIVPVAAAE